MLWSGPVLARQARIRSARPTISPLDCGPRSPLPPLKIATSAPRDRRVVPEVADRGDLRRGIDDHRRAELVRDLDDPLERRRGIHPVLAAEEEDAGGVRADRGAQVGLGRTALDDDRAGLPRRVVVAVAVPLEDHDFLARVSLELREEHARVGLGADDAGRDRQRDRRRRAAGDVGGLVLRNLGEAAGDRLVRLRQIEECPSRAAHRVEDGGRHQRTAELGQRGGSVDHRRDAVFRVVDHLGPPSGAGAPVLASAGDRYGSTAGRMRKRPSRSGRDDPSGGVRPPRRSGPRDP